MRVSLTALVLALAAAAGLHAQTTPGAGTATTGGTTTAGTSGTTTTTTPPTAATTAKLDGYLQRWEQEMRKVQTLSAVLARIDKDKAFGATNKFTGTAQYMKTGTGATAMNLAMLELRQEGKTDIAEKFVCTGTYLYQFLAAQKEIRAYEIPKPKPGQVGEDSFLGFLFGMKSEEAKRRYALTLAKEDTWYIYVDVVPRFAADRADFARARLVLLKDTFLPRQLWFEHTNGNEVTWDIQRLDPKASIDRRAFDAPKAPAGWKLNVVPRGTAAAATTTGTETPRVARPASKDR